MQEKSFKIVKKILPADNGADARRWGSEEVRASYLRTSPDPVAAKRQPKGLRLVWTDAL